MLTANHIVAYKQSVPHYSMTPPFNAPESYPENPFETPVDVTNEVYRSIRQCFKLLGLDSNNYGKKHWNPLRSIIYPGNTVLVKPNMIAHSHKYKDDWDYVITHGSIIRSVVDYAYIALNGEGKIIIADAPQTDSDIALIKERMGIEYLQDFYWKERRFSIDFIDLRNERWIEKDGICIAAEKLPGDPLGNAQVDLAKVSFFSEVDKLHKRYYGAFYDVEQTNLHHSKGHHEYMISGTALNADVFISLPKLKTHKKVGVTLNLKGLVGINGDKNWLPHYAIGTPAENGDQFPSRSLSIQIEKKIVLAVKNFLLKKNPLMIWAARRLKKSAYRVLGTTEDVVRSGNWHGNDTCWRMVLDLARILLYADANGILGSTPKRFFSVVDGIKGMQGNGPLAGEPKPVGMIIAGLNPLATDVACAQLMGLDYRKMPMLYRGFDQGPYPLCSFSADDIHVTSNCKELHGRLADLVPASSDSFKPPIGWTGFL